MATVTTTEVRVVSVELKLTFDEAETLLAYLDSPNGAQFRQDNPELYAIADDLEAVLA